MNEQKYIRVENKRIKTMCGTLKEIVDDKHFVAIFKGGVEILCCKNFWKIGD